VTDLLDRVAATGLIAAGRPLLVLLSGGQDSVCLLDVAVRLGADVEALHVNYGLRDAADGDEAHCADLCARLGVPLHVHRPRHTRGNVQAWARDERYAEAARLARGDIAAGHTATDQVETVLYRLAASPGRRALLGMQARDGRLVRPLLGVTRAETAAHCATRGLPYCEDASNADSTRGRIRALLPTLHPAAEANILATLALLRDEAAVLDAVVEDALAAAGDPPAVDALRALPPALRRLAVQRLAGDTPVTRRTDEILALGDGAAVDVGAGLRAEVRRGTLRFGPSEGRAAPRRADS
jgi:tRNA(Ile)-lysidine synthase